MRYGVTFVSWKYDLLSMFVIGVVYVIYVTLEHVINEIGL